MPHEKPDTDVAPTENAPAEETMVRAPQTPAYEPGEERDEWLDEPGELPRRPRRRLLAPVPLALIGVLLIACGFIGGVLVEKGQTSSGSSAAAASTLASRFAALRGGGSGARAGAAAGAGAALAGRAGGFAGAGGGGGATAGQVAYVSGDTLYVTTAEGNTVKVTTSPATSVTKTVKTSVKGIHPGETVTATGATGANGAVSAESIRVGAGGALGALLGGSGTGTPSKSQSSGTGGGEPALFGPGGG